MGINIDPTIYNVVLPEPSDYAQSRAQSIDGESLNHYGNAQQSQELSKRFSMKKYLGLTDEEIKINEYMKAEELGLNPNTTKNYLAQVYNPEVAEQGGFEGGLGGLSSYGGRGGGKIPKGGLDLKDKGELDKGLEKDAGNDTTDGDNPLGGNNDGNSQSPPPKGGESTPRSQDSPDNAS